MDARTYVDLAMAVAAIGAVGFAYELGSRRRQDRVTIDGLRRALADTFPELPGVALGSAVISASPAAGIGGDIVDVFALDGRFALLLVADVSGRGVAAAAHTAFIKYTLRTLALESDGDPAVVLAKFNALYHGTIKDDEAFVVLILGVLDTQTGDVRYASAGHEPAFVRRRGGSVRLLAPTGTIVGASPFSAYRSDVVTLAPGDVLVWATDGLTESRDRKGRLLGAEGLAGWIAAAPNDAHAVADWLVARLRQRSCGRAQDDVAVLTVAYDPAAIRAPRRALAADDYDSLLTDVRGPGL